MYMLSFEINPTCLISSDSDWPEEVLLRLLREMIGFRVNGKKRGWVTATGVVQSHLFPSWNKWTTKQEIVRLQFPNLVLTCKWTMSLVKTVDCFLNIEDCYKKKCMLENQVTILRCLDEPSCHFRTSGGTKLPFRRNQFAILGHLEVLSHHFRTSKRTIDSLEWGTCNVPEPVKEVFHVWWHLLSFQI